MNIIKEYTDNDWSEFSDTKNKIYYHGRTVHATEFSYQYTGSKEAVDRYGSGFYFTNSLNAAMSYTGQHGALLKCKINYNKVLTDKTKPNKKIIETLIKKSPVAKEVLDDFGETTRIGFINAMNAYSDLIGGYIYQTIENDFYSNNSKMFLEIFSKFYDIYYPQENDEFPKSQIILCYRPDIIDVIDVKTF